MIKKDRKRRTAVERMALHIHSGAVFILISAWAPISNFDKKEGRLLEGRRLIDGGGARG